MSSTDKAETEQLPPTPNTTADDAQPPQEQEDQQQTKEEWEQKRDEHKSLADNAFRSKNYPLAIQEYTNAITFDPEYHILYSNRSAAYLSNGEKSKSLADAKKCVALQPDFVKGHSRLASAMISLGRWNEARGVYRHILKDLDEDNAVAKKGLEDCRERELKAKEMEREMLKRVQLQKEEEEKKKKQQEDAEKEQQSKKKESDQADNKDDAGAAVDDDDGDGEDDLLNDFFDEVEDDAKAKKKPKQEEEDEKQKENEEKKENKIQIQLSDLGDTKTQIDRILCSNHEWYNLNPFRVLDISHEAELDLLSRRYKALSLLLHPDKVRVSNNNNSDELVEKAETAFEYIRKAINTLKDEDKRKHNVDLIEQGMKQGKRDYEIAQNTNSLGGKTLEKYQEIATMKIFAEIERTRRDVERRKRKFEEREREQEDAEEAKIKHERDFEKTWKQEGRVEKRINNWRDFSNKKKR